MKKDGIRVLQGTICLNEKVAKDTYKMMIECPALDVKIILPGQFICLAPLDPSSVMARPFSIFGVSTPANLFTILYRVVGKNTRLMSQLEPGREIKFWGPLGKSPTIDFAGCQPFLVGGGIGIAPLVFFESALKNQGYLPRVVYGNKTDSEIIPGIGNYLCTDDGSARYHGLVTDHFENVVETYSGPKKVVIACGPLPMMRKVAEISERCKLDCYVILERVMACGGRGDCLGCSIKTESGMRTICVDGPVFPAKEVWNALQG